MLIYNSRSGIFNLDLNRIKISRFGIESNEINIIDSIWFKSSWISPNQSIEPILNRYICHIYKKGNISWYSASDYYSIIIVILYYLWNAQIPPISRLCRYLIICDVLSLSQVTFHIRSNILYVYWFYILNRIGVRLNRGWTSLLGTHYRIHSIFLMGVDNHNNNIED